MRNWIAGAMTVLGTLLVLGGAVIIVIRAWFGSAKPTEPAAGDSAATPASGFSASGLFSTPPAERERGWRGLLRMSPPDRLIAWGIVLLVLAAVAAGAISFDLGAAAPAK